MSTPTSASAENFDNVPLPRDGGTDVALGANTESADVARMGREFSLADVLGALLRHWKLVVFVPLLVFGAAVALTLGKPRVYRATASFLPQGGDASARSRISGIAAQFGVMMPSADGGRSPAFYVDLLQSHELLRETVLSNFAVGGKRGTLVTMFAVDSAVTPRSTERAVELLRASVSAGARRETGVVELAVTTVSPELSRQIADRLVTLVNEFNLKSRQVQAGAEREFVQSRLAAANAELRRAEDELAGFLTSNRAWRGSPQLETRYNRLERVAQLRQQVVVSLAQAYETARIDEVRNTPVVVPVEQPYAPIRPVPRRLAEKALLSLLGGVAVALLTVFAIEAFAGLRTRDPAAYARFKAVRGRLPFMRRPRKVA